MSRHVDHWTLAETGQCVYCGDDNVLVFHDPFGQALACRPCWERITYGEEDDD